MGCRKAEKADQKGHRCDQRELPRQETRPERSRKGLQGAAQGPRGAPEANQGPKVWKIHSEIDVFKKKH